MTTPPTNGAAKHAALPFALPEPEGPHFYDAQFRAVALFDKAKVQVDAVKYGMAYFDVAWGVFLGVGLWWGMFSPWVTLALALVFPLCHKASRRYASKTIAEAEDVLAKGRSSASE